MTLFIKMPVESPFFEDFKARYLELTGEKIQDNPLTNEQETHYLVGSSRLLQDKADQLVSDFPTVSISNVMPIGWVTKEY